MKKAAATRQNLLNKAFGLIYTHGYQTTSIDDILAGTDVTKGAFYYHFRNKDEMGLAIIHEVILPVMDEHLVRPMMRSDHPVRDIHALVKKLLHETPFLQPQYGCPVDNLAQEAPHLQEAFGQALQEIVTRCCKGVEQCIANGKKAGRIRTEVNGRQAALFVMSGYWGVRSFGKVCDPGKAYDAYLKELKRYLKGME